MVSLNVFSMMLAGCSNHSAVQNYPHMSWQQAMQVKMAEYGPKAQKKMGPYFAKANVKYPPYALELLVFKDTKRLEIWAKNDENSSWAYVYRFPVLAASGNPGPKLRMGDRQVPEGIYRITELNPLSRFDLSMHINYPNDFDAHEAQQDGRKNLGGDIYIHGDKKSIGCIAIGNEGIEELFPLVHLVGLSRVNVIIAPNDLRKSPPIVPPALSPKWASLLYKQIGQALNEFR